MRQREAEGDIAKMAALIEELEEKDKLQNEEDQ